MAIWNFNANPAVTPIPTPAAWIYSGFSQTGTTASSTTITVLSVGTGMLAVGQVVTGAGIVNNPPTTIASITNNTTIVLSQAATASASGVTLTFQGVPGLQSSVFNNYGFFGVPSPTATDVVGCAFAIPEVQALNAGSTFIPAPGFGLISLTSGTTTGAGIQLQTASGTWTTIFTGTVSATTYYQGLIMCDGGNVRINMASATAGSFTFYRLRNPTY